MPRLSRSSSPAEIFSSSAAMLEVSVPKTPAAFHSETSVDGDCRAKPSSSVEAARQVRDVGTDFRTRWKNLTG
jgi:hypothetical protein